METAGACFERCLGQAPAEVLMLRQLEAATASIVAQSLTDGMQALVLRLAPGPARGGHGLKPQFKTARAAPRLQGIHNRKQP